MSLVQISNLSFDYHNDHFFKLAIDKFHLEKDELVFIEGDSGSGKTTFLNLLTGLITPKQGKISVLGTQLTSLSTTAVDRFRSDHFGIIFQLFNLIDYLSVIDNIILPCHFSKVRKANVLKNTKNLRDEAKRLSRELDISDSLWEKPVHALSIGQQQRVAIARALIGHPEIIIADEPTSALDNTRKKQFIELLVKHCKASQSTLIFVSHDLGLKPYFSSTYHINDIIK